MDEKLMEVDFKKYCPKCENWKKKEYEDPCNECLDYGANQNSTKPVYFKEKS